MNLNLEDRLGVLVALGDRLRQLGLSEEVTHLAKIRNPWFTPDKVKTAILAIEEDYLSEEKLRTWLDKYPKAEQAKNRNVGLLLAGNIPFVGFYDVLCTFLCGHQAQIKMSEKDEVLMMSLLNLIKEIEPTASSYFTKVERLKEYDAVIATGSDSSGRYFEKYFAAVPHIIRRNRTAVAVLFNDTPDDLIVPLADDLLAYYGLGCRNVSKLYLDKDFDLQRVFKILEPHRDIVNHHKYKNNYDYNMALYMMNKELFLTNDFFILREAKAINARIASAHYEHFSDPNVLEQHLSESKDKLQCIISDRNIGALRSIPIGRSQRPQLADYADGVDVMDFLTTL